jgi:hypothetical protein
MTLKNAALLALAAMLVLTAVEFFDLVNSALAVSRGLLPAVALLRSLLYALVSLFVLVFFYVFHKGL